MEILGIPRPGRASRHSEKKSIHDGVDAGLSVTALVRSYVPKSAVQSKRSRNTHLAAPADGTDAGKHDPGPAASRSRRLPGRGPARAARPRAWAAVQPPPHSDSGRACRRAAGPVRVRRCGRQNPRLLVTPRSPAAGAADSRRRRRGACAAEVTRHKEADDRRPRGPAWLGRFRQKARQGSTGGWSPSPG